MSEHEKQMHEAWSNAPTPVPWPTFVAIWRAALATREEPSSSGMREALIELVRLRDLKDSDPTAYAAEGAAKDRAWELAVAALAAREEPTDEQVEILVRCLEGICVFNGLRVDPGDLALKARGILTAVFRAPANGGPTPREAVRAYHDAVASRQRAERVHDFLLVAREDTERPDEDPMPVFTIQGKDLLAVPVIAYYQQQIEGLWDSAQAYWVEQARLEIEAWQRRNRARCKYADHKHVPVVRDTEQGPER